MAKAFEFIKDKLTKGKTKDRSKVYNESIVLIGPVGSGKSTISGALHQRTGLPVINLDIMRHCPMDMESINRAQQNAEYRIGAARFEMGKNPDPETRAMLEQQLRDAQNDSWMWSERAKIRKMLPNLPNYESMGFNGDVSHWLDDNYGRVAWHMYHKQFETQLLSALSQQLNVPAIIDMGGGMSVSLDKDYYPYYNSFQKLNPELFKANFDISKIGFNHIQDALAPFKNVVALQLPENTAEWGDRAKEDALNPYIIDSHQNEALATKSVSISGLYQRGIIPLPI